MQDPPRNDQCVGRTREAGFPIFLREVNGYGGQSETLLCLVAISFAEKMHEASILIFSLNGLEN